MVGLVSPHPDHADTARLRSNVFKVLGNEDVFLSACIVMMFNMMVHCNFQGVIITPLVGLI